MLPKNYRLKKMKDFETLFKEGRFVRGGIVDVKVWKIDPEEYPRRKYSVDDLLIGFVVGVKVSKIAVKRNRAKRQMREVVRLLLKNKKVKNGFMILIMGKAVDVEYGKVEKSVVGVLRKAGVLQ